MSFSVTKCEMSLRLTESGSLSLGMYIISGLICKTLNIHFLKILARLDSSFVKP
jgi:hypothetical protein